MDQIIKCPLKSLSEAPQNSRKHTESQIDQIAESIKVFGWTIPVLIDENNMIIAGHARVRAAKKLGIVDAPCIIATDWDANKKEAYQIADNRLSELSEWDTDILDAQIKRLNAAKFDMGFLDMSGFNTELYKPSLNPNFKIGDVSGDAVKQAQSGQDNKFDAKPGQEYAVTCPHCGEDFDVTI